MSYTNKTYVAFDADNDIHYYRLMQAWKQNDNTSFNFYDAHDLTNIMSWSSEESIKQSLQERLRNTKVFILLIGDNTKYLYKFVRWEIEQAIKKQIPIIAVNLNGKRSKDPAICPSILNEELVVFVSFNQRIVEHAINNWYDNDQKYREDGQMGAYYYKDQVYKDLGI